MIASSKQGRPGGAKAVLYTVLGEFVLPQGGSAWTSSLVSACGLLDVTEKNARQAIARVAEQGIIESERHGRLVRWHLTNSGRRLLESGAARIYHFGTETIEWDGEWLLAHLPVPEAQRAVRHQLRATLTFEGFGELAASLAISPHTGREAELRRILAQFELDDVSVILRSRAGSREEDTDLVNRAWDLDGLASAYRSFVDVHRERTPTSPETCFRSLVELVHDWRRFPFADPELPTELLPEQWVGTTASRVFHDRREAWSGAAGEWYAEQESQEPGI